MPTDTDKTAVQAPADQASAGRAILVVPADALVIVPIHNAVLFPRMILPLTIARQPAILAAQQAVKSGSAVGIVLQPNAEIDEPGPDDLFQIGTVATILRYVTLPDSSHVIVCQGEQRFRVVEYLPDYPFPVARVVRLEEPEDEVLRISAVRTSASRPRRPSTIASASMCCASRCARSRSANWAKVTTRGQAGDRTLARPSPPPACPKRPRSTRARN
jgi:ATP-dependent Lon protease